MKLAVLFFLSWPFVVWADRWEPDAPDVLNLKFGSLSPALRVDARGASDSSVSDVNYEPSPLSKTFVALGYRNLGAFVSWSNSQSAEIRNSQGDSSALDLQLSFFGRKWSQQYFYQSYKGYHIHNTVAINPSYPANQYILRPDLSTQHYGGNFIFNFQPQNYSLRTAFDQTGRQKENGGAWLMMLGLHNHQFSNGSQDIIPIEMSGKFGELARLQSGNLTQAGIAGGGGYTWVFFEKWYASFQALFGYGWTHQSLETQEAYYTRWDSATIGNAMFGLGYNGVNSYFVVQGKTDSHTYNLPDMGLQLTASEAWVHYGRRFDGTDVPFLNGISAWLD